MKVHIMDKTTKAEPVAEMTMIVPSEELGIVSEMVTDPAKLEELVPVSGLGAKAASMSDACEDAKPEYPVVRVEEGWSNSHNLWTGRELESIVRQVNELEPVGHLGHIPDDQEATALPDVQTTWLGAVLVDEPSKQKERVGEMVKVAYFAGYNHPGAKIRRLLRTRAVRGVSWWGHAHKKPILGKGLEMVGFELKALDWARKLSEGMPTSRVVAIASEMEGSDKMDKELSQITPAEFKEHNPNAHALIVAEAQSEIQERVSEMETEAEAGKSYKSLLDEVMSVLGVAETDNLVSAVKAIKDRVGAKAKLMVNEALDTLLTEKVPDEEKRALVRRLLPVGEMESAVENAEDSEAVKKTVGEMVDKAFEDDDMVKTVVSEMSPPVIRRAEQLRAGNSLDDNPYVEDRKTVSVG